MTKIAPDAAKNAFIAAIRSVGEKEDAAAVGIFKAASNIMSLLPEKLEDKAAKVSLDRSAVMAHGLTDYKLRPHARPPLFELLGKRPDKAAKSNVRLRSMFDQWNADARNIERALHVALIVASGNNSISQFDGATFSMDASALVDALNKNDKSKHKIANVNANKTHRVIFGRAKPDVLIVVRDNGAVECIKCSFATLTKAFPLVTKPKAASAGKDAQQDAFVNTTKAMVALLDNDEQTGTLSDAQRETLATLVAKINTRLGITIVKQSAPRKTNGKKAA